MALHPDKGLLRAVRAVTIAVIALTISLGSHGFAHGEIPGAGALVSGLAVTLLIGLNTSGRRYTTGRALIVLLAVQPALHVLFVVGAHGAHPVNSAGSVLPSAPTAGPAMVGAHLLAAGLAAVWIGHGDGLLWRWVGQVWQRLVRASSPLPEFIAPLSGGSKECPSWSTLGRLTGSLSHRGPPLAV